MNLNSPDENEDFGGDDEWEFKAAESESGTGDKDTKGDERKVENPEGTTHALGFGSGVLGAGDLFGASQQTSNKSTGRDFGMMPKKSRFPPQMMELILMRSLGNLKMHFQKLDQRKRKSQRLLKFLLLWKHFHLMVKLREAWPGQSAIKVPCRLSIFGDEEQDSNDPVSDQDISPQLSSSKPIDGVTSPHLNISINDLISSLYSQAEHDTAVNLCQNPSDSGLSPANVVIESNLAGNSDDFDDDSWEFKDASSVIRAEDQEELHFLALCHLDNLKKAQGAASDDAEVKALGKEIQNLHDELQQDGLFSGEDDTGNHSPRKLCLDEFVEVLQEPKFQVFESEYQLTSKLSLVENDLRLTMELHKYVASTIKILTLVSGAEQSSYVSTWSEILSVCARELKHGASIWTQSLQKDVHDQILSKPQGKNYIVALGEIYRVVEVIGSSARLYKPWLLVSSTNPMCLLTLLSECFTIWSSSGLEEALQSISDPAGLDYNGGLTTLIESIKYIHNLDACTLYNHVFGGQGPICQLSVLTAGTVPGMETVVWNGEHYFLTLANLWANLGISHSCTVTSIPPVKKRPKWCLLETRSDSQVPSQHLYWLPFFTSRL
ncbi:hypothetical protein OIU85_005024 [Salix viminalis]|uniref:Synergin gamma C-terminal domain-containing protein n=1 Tax=Salix viminalis TaxID=40686 RepID=A0A9Q0PUJ8_SALVM|nr:hypothetical protein OIU85_005024 [Salix viminalis]